MRIERLLWALALTPPAEFWLACLLGPVPLAVLYHWLAAIERRRRERAWHRRVDAWVARVAAGWPEPGDGPTSREGGE